MKKTIVKCPRCYTQITVNDDAKTVGCVCKFQDKIEKFIPKHFIGNLQKEEKKRVFET